MFRGLGIGRQACNRKTSWHYVTLMEMSDMNLNLSNVTETTEKGIDS